MRVRSNEDSFGMGAMYAGVQWGRACMTHTVGILIPGLIAAIGAETCIEIGIFNAFTTEMFLRGLSSIEDSVLFSCDRTHHACARATEMHDRFLQSTVEHHVINANSRNLDWVVELGRANRSHCDIALVDGDHSREGAGIDLSKIAHVLRPGGLIIAHDYTEEEPGCIAAIEEFTFKRGFRALVFPDCPQAEDKGFVILQKP